MKTHHPQNERIKRRYREYLKEADGQAEASLAAVDKALSRFETYTKHRDFKAFRPEQAKAFKARRGSQVNARTGERPWRHGIRANHAVMSWARSSALTAGSLAAARALL